jgi:hypothetical protein
MSYILANFSLSSDCSVEEREVSFGSSSIRAVLPIERVQCTSTVTLIAKKRKRLIRERKRKRER